MKKLPLLCILTSLLLVSCKMSMTYESLISKMKTYPGETIMSNYYSSGSYTEEGFFTDDSGKVTLYQNGSKAGNYELFTFITLPNSTSAPNSYYCLYQWETYSSLSTTKELASFYIDNNRSSSTKIVFDTYTGSSDLRESSQDLARSSINLLLTSFRIWVEDEFNINYKSIGVFPNY